MACRADGSAAPAYRCLVWQAGVSFCAWWVHSPGRVFCCSLKWTRSPSPSARESPLPQLGGRPPSCNVLPAGTAKSTWEGLSFSGVADLTTVRFFLSQFTPCLESPPRQLTSLQNNRAPCNSHNVSCKAITLPCARTPLFRKRPPRRTGIWVLWQQAEKGAGCSLHSDRSSRPRSTLCDWGSVHVGAGSCLSGRAEWGHVSP